MTVVKNVLEEFLPSPLVLIILDYYVETADDAIANNHNLKFFAQKACKDFCSRVNLLDLFIEVIEMRIRYTPCSWLCCERLCRSCWYQPVWDSVISYGIKSWEHPKIITKMIRHHFNEELRAHFRRL
jgi:hypothetical protein